MNTLKYKRRIFRLHYDWNEANGMTVDLNIAAFEIYRKFTAIFGIIRCGASKIMI